MLVLSRKVGERILIGTDVEIVLVSIEGPRVKVGVSAPRCLKVLRGELQPDDDYEDEPCAA